MHPNAVLFWEITSFVWIWISLAYLVALVKAPSLMMDLFADNHLINTYHYPFLEALYGRPRWLRRVSSAIVFIVFLFPLFIGFARLTQASLFSEGDSTIHTLLVVIPMGVCAFGGALAVVMCGWYVGNEHRDFLIKKHDQEKAS